MDINNMTLDEVRTLLSKMHNTGCTNPKTLAVATPYGFDSKHKHFSSVGALQARLSDLGRAHGDAWTRQ